MMTLPALYPAVVDVPGADLSRLARCLCSSSTPSASTTGRKLGACLGNLRPAITGEFQTGLDKRTAVRWMPNRRPSIEPICAYQSRLRRPSRNDFSVDFALTACSPGSDWMLSRTFDALA